MLARCLDVILCSCLARGDRVQSWIHSRLHRFLIVFFLADLRGNRFKTSGWASFGLLAACLAASSAFSFPRILSWPGIQWRIMWMFGCSLFRVSRLLSVEWIIDCPDCFGLVVAIIAAWLSV